MASRKKAAPRVEKLRVELSPVQQFSLLGKPWLKPTKGMKVALSPDCPKFLQDLTEKTGKAREGRVVEVHSDPHSGAVWCDVAWDGVDGSAPAFHTGYHCGRFGNFHLMLIDLKLLKSIRSAWDEKLPPELRGQVPRSPEPSMRETVQSSGMCLGVPLADKPLDRLKTPARLFHDHQTTEWGLDPKGDHKTNNRMRIEMQFWEKEKQKETEQTRDPNKKPTGRAANRMASEDLRPETAAGRMEDAEYGAGGQVIFKPHKVFHEEGRPTHKTDKTLRSM